MMRGARIDNGVVADVWVVPSLTAFDGVDLVEVPDDVSVGWLHDGANFTPPPVPALTPKQLREQAKATRAAAVEAITVTTAAGNTFDGDETAQTRMARAVLVLSTGAALSVPWVLADNTVIQATAAELTEALALAGAAQAALWVV